MKNEDLIKKLENAELPDPELRSHKLALRMKLLSSDYFGKENYLLIFKRFLLFSGPALAILAVVFFNIIQPKITEAKILSITKNNSEIQQLMEENSLVLDEIKIKDNRAYVLLNSSESEKTSVIKITQQEVGKKLGESVGGAIIEIDVKNKKVAKINKINGEDVSPLNTEEKESAQKITEAEKTIKEIIPEGAEIEKIESSLPQKMHLVDDDHSVRVVPNSENGKKAEVHYNLNGEKWVIQVNLDEKKVEEIEHSSDKNNKSKGRD